MKIKTNIWLKTIILGLITTTCALSYASQNSLGYPVVDTGQNKSYDTRQEISNPHVDDQFYGQDAQFTGHTASYRDNENGTVTDFVTGLTWSKQVDGKYSLDEANKRSENLTLGGYNDWRVPTIKELYSLIDFRGTTGFSGRNMHSEAPSNAIPYINTDFFDFQYGDVSQGDRYIDAQWLSRTTYVSLTMNRMVTLFGVNFADGRIKGYGYRRLESNRDRKTFFVRFVRGNNTYGENQFKDNQNGTITDYATSLIWVQADSGKAMNWEEALNYAKNLNYGGFDDWRLPDAKELQSIVDYTRSPDTTGSPAIDPLFTTTEVKNELGETDYPYFWTSTTHLDGPVPASGAVYISFGRAIGQMRGEIMDVHGAGAQRSDPKTGNAELGKGPQGDSRRVYNYVRCVRGGSVTEVTAPAVTDMNAYPENIKEIDIKGQSSREPIFPAEKNHRFVNRLDQDGDGKVSRSEFDGPVHHFDKLDKNRDGYLTGDEAPERRSQHGKRSD